MKRLAALTLVAIALAPGTWVRTAQPLIETNAITVTRLPIDGGRIGAFVLDGVWHITGSVAHFGGYSALLDRGGGRFLAGSDRGHHVAFRLEEGAGQSVETDMFDALDGAAENGTPRSYDLESLTADPATGRIWAGFENSNAVQLFDADLRQIRERRPDAMRDWSANSGPEAMVRLADGRFIAIAEGPSDEGNGRHDAVLFASDPTAAGPQAVTAFQFRPPQGFRPVDMVELPGGRALILVRKVVWGLPPGFAGAIVLADPARYSCRLCVAGARHCEFGRPGMERQFRRNDSDARR